MRKIPATMATQHPDNSRPTYFSNRRFVAANDEVEECYRCFSELGVQEFMWDWEGKFVDEAVIDRLYNGYHDYFQKHPIGKDLFLTFRVPNVWIESNHKLPRSLMGLLSAEEAAKTYKFYGPPLFEIILPMTTKAEQLIYLQKSFKRIAAASKDFFDVKSKLDFINVIPLFEEFSVMENCQEILHGYVNFLKEEYGYKPPYLRIFTARSDPAVNAGFLPAKMANRLAVHLYHEFEEQTGIKVFPWVGGGALPFRGGINPENIDAVVEEYRGVSTVTVQSAFRYDYDLPQVKAAIKRLNEEIPKNHKKYVKLTKEEVETVKKFNKAAADFYRPVIENSADIINKVADKLPGHRERVQHVGLFGYSRGLGKVQLPRAIKFTGALYSLGVPPELIGSGRALKYAKEKGMLDLVMKLCPYLKADFEHAGHYLNRENLDFMCKKNPVWEKVREDIQLIEEVLEIKIGPTKTHQIIHRNFTSNIFHKMNLGEEFDEDILKAAEIRKSLG